MNQDLTRPADGGAATASGDGASAGVPVGSAQTLSGSERRMAKIVALKRENGAIEGTWLKLSDLLA